MFSLTSPSLLAFDQERSEGHVHTIDGIERVPCDTRMRAILAPLSPKGLRPVFTRVFRQLPRGKALAPRAFLDGPSGLALDGPGYFSSKTLPCASCRHKGHRNGSSTSSHQGLGAAILPPEGRAVMPLRPARSAQPDGTDNNDCERHAAQRFVAQLRQDPPHLKCLITADSLRAHAPHIETLHAHGVPSILGVNAGDHP